MIIDSPIISGSTAASGSLNQVGNITITGSLTVTGNITGNITGSATNAISASYAAASTSASYAVNATSASYANSATSASYALNSTSASYAANATSASYAANATSASYAANATSASFSATASYLSNYIPPFPYTGSADISGSLVVNGNITAQTLIVQTITSSEDFVTGSTHFGSLVANTHQFTGSVTVSGSLAVNGSTAILTNQTGAMSVATASYVANAVSASFATTASYVSSNFQYEVHVSQVDGNDTTGNGDLLKPVASITKALQIVSASVALTDRRTIIVHPGTYTENVTVSTGTYIIAPGALGANTAIAGTVTVNATTRITGIKMTNLVVNTTTPVYLYNSTVDNQITITNTGYVEATGCSFQCPSGVTISGAAPAVIFNACTIWGLVVNNASAVVIVRNSPQVYVATVLAGNLALSNTLLFSATNNGNAITTSAGSFVTLSNLNILIPTGLNVARVSLSGFYSIIDVVYDKPNSTLVALSGTGGPLNAIDYFQYIDADNITTKGLTVTGSINVSGSVINNLTSSFAVSASQAQNASAAASASYALTASYASNVPATSSFAVSASVALNAISASYITGSNVVGTVASATSASYALTASYASNVPATSSFAVSASQAQNAVSAAYSAYALTSSYSLAGSGFPFSGSAVITGSLLVTNLSSSGVSYLVANAAGFVTAQTASAAIKSTQAVTSTAGQTSFNITNGYTTGLVDVYINGTKLSAVEYTDTSGTVITLATGSNSGDTVEFVKYFPASGVTNNALRQLTTFTASAAQTVFSASYTPGLLDVFYNGSRLSNGEYAANNGTFFTLATASVAGDILDVFVYSYQVGAFSGIGGAGVANQISYFNTTNVITGSPNFTISGSTMLITGSLIVSGSGTFTNIGPAVFSGSLTSTAGFTGSFSGTATSASYASTASYVLTAQTASYVLNAVSSSFATSAITASYADSLTVAGTLTAQTLVVQTITSSVDFVTGSTRFGSILGNTHQFTGSVSMTGSLAVITTGTEFQVTSTGVILGNASTDTHTITGSVNITGSQTISNGDLTLSGNRSIFLSNNNTAAGAIRFYNSTSGSTKSAIGSYYNIADEGNLEFLTGGTTTRMVINSSGNVGIGTTSPLSTLQVGNGTQTGINGASNKIHIATTGTRSALLTLANSSGAVTVEGQFESSAESADLRVIIGSTSNHDVVLRSNNVERIRITSGSGNVGIGTSDPAGKLAVLAGTYQHLIYKAESTYQSSLRFNEANNGARFYTDAGTEEFRMQQQYTSTGFLSFYTGATERMRISNTGAITTSSTLSVGGNASMARFYANCAFSSYTGDGLFNAASLYCSISTPGASDRIRLGYNDYGSGQYWGRIGFAATTNWSLGIITGAGNDFSIGTGYNGSQLYIYSNGNYAFSGSNVSDRRKKTNINYITTSQLDTILKLKPVTFNKIADEVVSENVHTGFIAQDIMEENIPNLVMGSDEGGYGLDYEGVLALAVKAIQEQQALITALQEKLERNNII
jgi:hypothetical protein